MIRSRRYVKLVIERKTAAGLMAVALLGVLASPLVSQQLSMTATYPIPAGVYNQIVTTGNSGATPANTTLNRNAGNTILVPPTNVSGQVGIGTASPGANYKLDVAGKVHASGDICSDQKGGACLNGVGGLGGFGGFYEISGDWSCYNPNPYTGRCTCPTGFTSFMINDFILTCAPNTFYYKPPPGGYCGVVMYQCVR